MMPSKESIAHLLQPDYMDNPQDITTSFASIRAKTLATLYHHDHQQEYCAGNNNNLLLAVKNDTNTNKKNNDSVDVKAVAVMNAEIAMNSSSFATASTIPHLAPSRSAPPISRDKSPKGSVDAAIQNLVDLINQHPSYATLSSCSGRIVLFDPQYYDTAAADGGGGSSTIVPSNATGLTAQQEHHLEHQQQEQELQEHPSSSTDSHHNDIVHGTSSSTSIGIRHHTTATTTASSSGKGGMGGWRLISHECIEEMDLLRHFTSSFSNTVQQQRNNNSTRPHEQDLQSGNTNLMETINDDDENADDMPVRMKSLNNSKEHQLDINYDSQQQQVSDAVPEMTAIASIAQFWSFRVEPMLLHVAASTMARGQQLLQVALACGLRESGLVVSTSASSGSTTEERDSTININTNNTINQYRRITVALRTTRFVLNVPLAPTGPMCPSISYLQGLVQEANRRLVLNLQLLQYVYQSIQNNLFVVVDPKVLLVPRHEGGNGTMGSQHTVTMNRTITSKPSQPIIKDQQYISKNHNDNDLDDRLFWEVQVHPLDDNTTNNSNHTTEIILDDTNRIIMTPPGADTATITATTTRRTFHSTTSCLNLWGHVAVSIPMAGMTNTTTSMKIQDNNENTHNHLLVFGGYGCGPMVSNTSPIPTSTMGHSVVKAIETAAHASAAAAESTPTLKSNKFISESLPNQRSDQIYCFRETIKGFYCWEILPVLNNSNHNHKERNDWHHNDNICINQSYDTVSTTTTNNTANHASASTLGVVPATWSGRQHAAACLFSTRLQLGQQQTLDLRMIVVFGGRTGPSHPLDELILLEYVACSLNQEQENCFSRETQNNDADQQHQQSNSSVSYDPTRGGCLFWHLAAESIQGHPPSARWGHSFTSLSNPGQTTDRDDGVLCRAVLIGGRNQHECVDPDNIYMFSLIATCKSVRDKEGEDCSDSTTEARSTMQFLWLWEAIQVSIGPCLHHATVFLPAHEDDYTLLVMGGLDSVDDILQAFGGANDGKPADRRYQFLQLTRSTMNDPSSLVARVVSARTMSKQVPLLSELWLDECCFGHSTTLFPLPMSTGCGAPHLVSEIRESMRFLVLQTGGVTKSQSGLVPHMHDRQLVTSSTPFVALYIARRDSNDNGASWCLQQVHHDRIALQSHVPALWVHHSAVQWMQISFPKSSQVMAHDKPDGASSLPLQERYQPYRRRYVGSLLLMGGGVPGFAFGPLFAATVLLHVYCSEGLAATRMEGQLISSILHEPTTINPSHSRGLVHVPLSKRNAPIPDSQQNAMVSVIYVAKRHAKIVKTALEQEGWLDKRYRMGPGGNSGVTYITLQGQQQELASIEEPSNSSALQSPVSSDDHLNKLKSSTYAKADKDWIAIPVTKSGLRFLLPSKTPTGTITNSIMSTWIEFVKAYGEQHLAFSSSMFATSTRMKQNHTARP